MKMQAMTSNSAKKVLVLGTGGTIAGLAAQAGDNLGYQAAQVGVTDLLVGVPGIAELLQDWQLESEQVAQAGLEHTAKDEDVRIPRGNAMDLVVERRVVRQVWGAMLLGEEIEIRLRNHGDREAPVEVLEHIPGAGDWRIAKQSHPHEKKDAATAAFRIQVPAGGETVLTYAWEGK